MSCRKIIDVYTENHNNMYKFWEVGSPFFNVNLVVHKGTARL